MIAGSEPPVAVLYIAGSGRSGSTLTDVLLDNHPSIVGVGELTNLVRGGFLGDRTCACGVSPAACPFWAEVRSAWQRRTAGLDLGGYVRLQEQFDWRALWTGLVDERTRQSPAFSRYAEWTVALYQAIREVSGKPWIVDSSKLPARAAALALMARIDLRVLHLVRDGRGVVYSVNKAMSSRASLSGPAVRVSRSGWRTALFWTIVNLRAAALRRRLPPARSLRVRYEDLVTEFPETARRLGNFMGLDFDALSRRVTAGEEFRRGHAVAGNRVRKVTSLRVRPDFEWRDRLAPRDRRIVWLIAGWLLRTYGYGHDGSIDRRRHRGHNKQATAGD